MRILSSLDSRLTSTQKANLINDIGIAFENKGINTTKIDVSTLDAEEYFNKYSHFYNGDRNPENGIMENIFEIRYNGEIIRVGINENGSMRIDRLDENGNEMIKTREDCYNILDISIEYILNDDDMRTHFELTSDMTNDEICQIMWSNDYEGVVTEMYFHVDGWLAFADQIAPDSMSDSTNQIDINHKKEDGWIGDIIDERDHDDGDRYDN